MNHLTKFKDLSLDYEGFILEPGQMIIWAEALRSLEERIEHAIHRMKYYEETADLSLLQDLLARTKQIRRTNQGSN